MIPSALTRICIDMSFTVVALWFAGRTNPFRSANSDTCGLLLRTLQFWSEVAVATSPTPPGSLPDMDSRPSVRREEDEANNNRY
jgi:hypothetical protein